jgi:alkylresorcinol/alkylpyrone synthase
MTRAPRILSVGTALPANRVSQQEARALIRAVFQNTSRDLERLLDVFDNGHVKTRYLGAPLDWYFDLKSWSERNALYVKVALEISERAALEAMRRAGVNASDLDAIFFVSSTGLATPSLDSWLIKRLGMSRHAVRVPIWGLGCAGGAAGVNRAAEYARANSSAKVLLIAVELSSLTFQANDASRANLISTSLFADGAAAVVIAGAEANLQTRGLEVLGGSSTLWDDTEDVMGWEVVDTGLKVLLSKSVPLVVEKHIREDVEHALEPLNLTRADIRHFVTHPGGEKVMQAFREALEVPESMLEDSRVVLEEHGNMSSPTVLFALERLLSRLETIASGEHALLTAMGPGFSAEHAILRSI